MLAVQQGRDSCHKYTPNILPCRIHHNGPSKITKRFWSPTTEKDQTKTAHFRGRRLRGRVVQLPDGYQGVLAKSKYRNLPLVSAKPCTAVPEDSAGDDDEEEEQPEPVKILETAGTFEDLTVWGHDLVPAVDDPFVKGVEEWITFAEAIHGRPQAKRSEDALAKQ